jgi:transglutaminase-like putative cysteine protease
MQLNFTRFITLIFVPFIVLTGFIARASDPVVHISPTPDWINVLKPYDKSIPLRTVENGYFYQLYEEQVQVEKQADYTHVIREIVSDAGIQNGSEVSVSFDPTYERIDFHKLIVWRDNKPQDRLKQGAFKVIADEKDLSRFIYQGTFSAYCILDDIRKGDKIEYSYTITGRNPIFGNKYFRDFYLQLGLPVAHIYKAVLASPGRKINIKTFNKAPKTAISIKNGLKCYEWEDFQVQPANDYDNEPGWYNNYNYVQVSDYADWKGVVDWGLSINPLPVNIKGGLAGQIAALKASSHGDKVAYFRSAVKLVQNEVRYMGVELGEYSHKANDPEKVFNQRYGDCKDKALLLATILNANGTPASLVLINSSVRGGISDLLPSPNDFDHMVVVANVNGKQVWVDATIADEGGTGAKLYFPNYGKGLVLKAGNNALTAIPLSESGKVTCQEKYKVTTEKDSVLLQVTTTYTLDEADGIRDKLSSNGMAQTEKDYLAYYQKIYPKIEMKDSIGLKDDPDKNVLITTENYIIRDFFKLDTTTGKYGASFYADYVSDQLTHAPNNVKGPIALNYPYDLDYTTVVILPIAWNHNDTNSKVTNDFFTFSSDYTADDDTLFLHFKLKYLTDFVPANKLDDYRQDVKQVEDNDLSYSFNYIPDISKVPATVNYWLITLAVMVTGLMCFAGILIYRRETNMLIFPPGKTFVTIGGWLILIILGLAFTAIAEFVHMFTNGYFNLHEWNACHQNFPVAGYRFCFVFEMLGNVVLMCYAIFCLILLLNTRDILPKFIIFFFVFALVFNAADYFLLLGFYHGTSTGYSANSLIRAIITAAIWIPYFRMSVRVRETFVTPYPASNYHYQQWEQAKTEEKETHDI